jgi:Flp pilus assembly protein TadD
VQLIGIPLPDAVLEPGSKGKDATVPKSNPETHVIDYRAAEQLLAARDPRGAVKLLDSLIAAHPENTAARLLRARAFFAAAQLRPAELEFELVLEREPDNAFAHFALARTFERAGRPEQAKRHFRLAAALDPKPEYVKAARFDAEA